MGKVVSRSVNICLWMAYSLMYSSSLANKFAGACQRYSSRFFVAAFSSPQSRYTSSETGNAANDNDEYSDNNSNVKTNYHRQTGSIYSPWNDPRLEERAERMKQSFRSRQHVNPLAAKFRQPTILSPNWPHDTFDNMARPLFLDIGCSRGGFLVDMAIQRPNDFNYLGLEIRPIIVRQAQQRIEKNCLKGCVDFVGCNANVDLERLLTLAEAQDKLKMVTIQFPDPHFKARHAKRRMVTSELVTSLAKFMPQGATVFLQSDVQSVLDDMRRQFRHQAEFFKDEVESVEDYLQENIFAIPTERELSVLERGLPVYRTIFTRTNKSAAGSGRTLQP